MKLLRVWCLDRHSTTITVSRQNPDRRTCLKPHVSFCLQSGDSTRWKYPHRAQVSHVTKDRAQEQGGWKLDIGSALNPSFRLLWSVNKEGKGPLMQLPHKSLLIKTSSGVSMIWTSSNPKPAPWLRAAHLPGLEFCRFWRGGFHRRGDNRGLHCLLLGLLWARQAKRSQRIDPVPTRGKEYLILAYRFTSTSLI